MAFLLNIITLTLQLIFSVNTQPRCGCNDEAVTRVSEVSYSLSHIKCSQGEWCLVRFSVALSIINYAIIKT